MSNTTRGATRPPESPKGAPKGTWPVRHEPYLIRGSGNAGRVVALHPNTGLIAGESRVIQFVTPQGWIILVPVGVDEGDDK